MVAATSRPSDVQDARRRENGWEVMTARMPSSPYGFLIGHADAGDPVCGIKIPCRGDPTRCRDDLALRHAASVRDIRGNPGLEGRIFRLPFPHRAAPSTDVVGRSGVRSAAFSRVDDRFFGLPGTLLDVSLAEGAGFEPAVGY